MIGPAASNFAGAERLGPIIDVLLNLSHFCDRYKRQKKKLFVAMARQRRGNVASYKVRRFSFTLRIRRNRESRGRLGHTLYLLW